MDRQGSSVHPPDMYCHLCYNSYHVHHFYHHCYSYCCYHHYNNHHYYPIFMTITFGPQMSLK